MSHDLPGFATPPSKAKLSKAELESVAALRHTLSKFLDAGCPDELLDTDTAVKEVQAFRDILDLTATDQVVHAQLVAEAESQNKALHEIIRVSGHSPCQETCSTQATCTHIKTSGCRFPS